MATDDELGSGHAHSPGPARGHAHGHSHGHAHGAHGHGFERPRSDRERVVWALAVLGALITILGIVSLWPAGDRLDEVKDEARLLGLTAERLRAEVVLAEDTDCSYSTPENPQQCRRIEVSPLEGPDTGDTFLLGEYNLRDPQLIEASPGDRIVVSYEPLTGAYLYADRERRAPLTWLFVVFAVSVLLLARWRGVMALGALALTLVLLLAFLLPAIMSGRPPLLVAIVGASAMAYIALYTTHGINTMTTVSLLGTLGALALTLGLGAAWFEFARFTGFVTEELAFLPIIAPGIDLRGLLLGGVVIGALGALDDVVITQAATVWELRAVNPEATTREVWGSAMRVGREHTGSIINTLLLAYAGASMPLLVLFSVSGQSLGVVANSELVALEIVRTLVGSIGLLFAVPFTTALAAYMSEPDRPSKDATRDASSAR